MELEIIDEMQVNDVLGWFNVIYDGKEYAFYVEWNEVMDDYTFYYCNGVKPSDIDFEYNFLCSM